MVNRPEQMQTPIEMDGRPFDVQKRDARPFKRLVQPRAAKRVEVPHHHHPFARRDPWRSPLGHQRGGAAPVFPAERIEMQVDHPEPRPAANLRELRPGREGRERPVKRPRVDHVRRFRKEEPALILKRKAVLSIENRLGRRKVAPWPDRRRPVGRVFGQKPFAREVLIVLIAAGKAFHLLKRDQVRLQPLEHRIHRSLSRLPRRTPPAMLGLRDKDVMHVQAGHAQRALGRLGQRVGCRKPPVPDADHKGEDDKSPEQGDHRAPHCGAPLTLWSYV